MHVTDSAIARSVMAARRALGETAADAEAIRTVHGRGYRFDRPVEAVIAPDDQDRPPRRRSLRPARLVAAGALTVLLGALVWLRAAPTPPADPDVSPARLSLRVVAATESDEIQLLALSLEEELGRALDAVAEVERVDGGDSAPPAYLLIARVTPGAAPGYAHVDVSVRPAGDEEGEGLPAIPLARHEVPYRLPAIGVGRFLAVRDAVARQVVARLPKALGPEAADSEAMRLYLTAVAGWTVSCDGSVAAELLSRAVELDPKLAPAWYMLAGAHWTRAELCVGDPALMDEAARAVERAQELEPEAPEPRQLAAAMALHRGRVDEAYVALRELATDHPDKPAVQVRLSEALRYAGFVDAAGEVMDRVLRSHPEASILANDPILAPLAGDARFQGVLAAASERHRRFARAHGLAPEMVPRAAEAATSPGHPR